MSSGSSTLMESWRDARTQPVPSGKALGILISTNCPFEISRIETEVSFSNPLALPNTSIEVGFFRNSSQFKHGMFVEPECTFSDVQGILTRTLTDLGNNRWMLSVTIPTYAWGTDRIVTIRAVPVSVGAVAQMSLVASTQIQPGFTAYVSDNTGNIFIAATLPKIRVWRRQISPFRSVAYSKFSSDLEIQFLPGYQIGTTSDLSTPINWTTDKLGFWTTTRDMRDSGGFFIMRPDPTE